VYDIEVNTSKGHPAVLNQSIVQIHIYPGTGVSAYNLSWQNRENLDQKDFMLESKHLLTVFNGTTNTTHLMIFAYQKDAKVRLNFTDISDGNATGRGELTTSSIKNKTIHYNMRIPTQGDLLTSANLNITTNVSDPPPNVVEQLTTPQESTEESPDVWEYMVNKVKNWMNEERQPRISGYVVHDLLTKPEMDEVTIPTNSSTVTTTQNPGQENVPFVARTEEDITPAIQGTKSHYKQTEDVTLEFEYTTEEKLLERGRSIAKSTKPKQIGKWTTTKETINITLTHPDRIRTPIQPEIQELREGKFKITLPKQRAFRAGLYTITIQLTKDGVTYSIEQDFTWGVLAINFNKTIYTPNEHTFIGIGVLNNNGAIVCDANVTLTITTPNNKTTTLTTTDNTIQISPECEFLGVTKLPDYYTNYSFADIGVYQTNLTAVTENGERRSAWSAA